MHRWTVQAWPSLLQTPLTAPGTKKVIDLLHSCNHLMYLFDWEIYVKIVSCVILVGQSPL